MEVNLKNALTQGSPLDIVIYPEAILAKKTAPITIFDDKLKKLAIDMLYTMYHAPGVGLAAPQVNRDMRMFVLDVEFDREKSADGMTYIFNNLNPMVFINPEITPMGNEKVKNQEGCLSLPGIYEDVNRFKTIKVKYQDLDGKTHELEASELLGVCIQHETDHLNGIMFIDHLSQLKHNFYRNKMIKQKKAFS
ncbi:MAG: peptide deformylase [Bacteriovoracaceae bacterium]|nr:peptide deformylase [Bacteriovoracaceae bacterium]